MRSYGKYIVTLSLFILACYVVLLYLTYKNVKQEIIEGLNARQLIQRAAAIVQDLLTLARRGVSGQKVLNLNKIVADCKKSPEFKNLSSYHPSIRIKTDLEPDLSNISGSPVHLEKTLLNLVSNASEAMPNGGVLTIKTANRYLDKPIQGYDEVRDVKEQRDLAAEMLSKLNYTITSVSSGEEAVAYLKEHQADLMVLDMIMDPGMDGLDTYRSVIEIHPKQKAIIVSGFSETYRVDAAQGLGAGAYVRKPYVIERLGLAVRKELDRKIDDGTFNSSHSNQ